MLGPAVNVAQLPTNGRNFEYILGEDGALGGAVMAAAVVRGVQSQGVVANAKHYVQNNQEYQRSTVDSIVDERTHVEVYLPPSSKMFREQNRNIRVASTSRCGTRQQRG